MDKKEIRNKLLGDKKNNATVELPVAYWKIILGLLDDRCEQVAEESRGAPESYLKMLPYQDPETLTRLNGPILARALIVERLVQEGFMKPCSDSEVGMEWFSSEVEKVLAKDMN